MSQQLATQTYQQPKTTPPPVSGVLQRKCACGQHTVAGGECAECRKKRLSLQHQAARQVEPNTVPPIVHEVLRSPGQPLDTATRASMEPHFGYDFSQVRVHTDAKAAESARAVNAYAYTVRRSVVFGRNQYAPGTVEGRKLLAHELVHTVQQQSGRLQGASRQLAISESAIHENEAITLAEQVVGEEKSASSNSTTGGPKSGVAASVSPLPAGITLLQRDERPPSRSVGSLRRLEETYRWGATQFADPQLREAALNVATCIEQEGRGAFCETLVTDDDLWQMYGEYTLIEDIFGTDRADAALRDHRLTTVAAEAAAAQSGSTTAVAGAAVAGVAPALPQAPVGPGPTVPTRPPLRVIPGGRGPFTPPTAPRTPPLRVIPGGGTGTAPRTAPRIPPGAVGPAIVIVVGIAVTVQLVEFGSFQRKAFDAGYRYLPSGRGVCMRGCHSPRAPQAPRIFESPPLPPLIQEPLSPPEIDIIQEWIRQTPPISGPQEEPSESPFPVPEPRPEPRRRERDDCLRTHPSALICDDFRNMEEVVVDFLINQDYPFDALGDCRGIDSFGPDVIDACNGAPGQRWHCRVNGTTDEVSIFGCLCCNEDGSTGYEWRGAHWSVSLSQGG